MLAPMLHANLAYAEPWAALPAKPSHLQALPALQSCRSWKPTHERALNDTRQEGPSAQGGHGPVGCRGSANELYLRIRGILDNRGS